MKKTTKNVQTMLLAIIWLRQHQHQRSKKCNHKVQSLAGVPLLDRCDTAVRSTLTLALEGKVHPCLGT